VRFKTVYDSVPVTVAGIWRRDVTKRTVAGSRYVQAAVVDAGPGTESTLPRLLVFLYQEGVVSTVSVGEPVFKAG
jgi:hypothetical protein